MSKMFMIMIRKNGKDDQTTYIGQNKTAAKKWVQEAFPGWDILEIWERVYVDRKLEVFRTD